MEKRATEEPEQERPGLDPDREGGCKGPRSRRDARNAPVGVARIGMAGTASGDDQLVALPFDRHAGKTVRGKPVRVFACRVHVEPCPEVVVGEDIDVRRPVLGVEQVVSGVVSDKDVRQAMWDQVEDLRKHLLRSILSLALMVSVSFFFTQSLINYLALPVGGIETLRLSVGYSDGP